MLRTRSESPSASASTAPISNAVTTALGNAQGYKYAHDDPDGVVPQQYPPDEVVGVDYYRPTGRGAERDIGTRLEKLRAIIRRKRG